MELIDSFKVDHTTLDVGIYVSRKDKVKGETVTTFDIRLKRPNVEKHLKPKVSHTIEHLIATFLRNDKEWKDKTIYWGPMGCLTGFYFIVKGDMEPKDVSGIINRAFCYVRDYFGDIPGSSPKQCGSWKYHNLKGAKKVAQEFLTRMYFYDTIDSIINSDNIKNGK